MAKGNGSDGVAVAAPEQARKLPELKFSELRPLETVAMSHYLVVPVGFGPKDLESHSMAIFAQTLKRFDTIFAVSMGNDWCAQYLVVDKWGSGVKLKLMYALPLDPQEPTRARQVPEGYAIEPAPVNAARPGYVVRRTKDGVVIIGADMPRETYELALRELLDHAALRKDVNPHYFGR